MQVLAFTKHDNNKDSILLFFISSFLFLNVKMLQNSPGVVDLLIQ